MFVPDMTPWDQILKAGEKQQEKFDKLEAEANALSGYKLRGGFSTNELSAPEYNIQIDALANEASSALENYNLAGARASVLKAKQLATSPQALTIKADEDFTMKNPTYVMELNTKDPTAVIPFMETDQNTGSKKVKQSKYGEIFDPLQRYGYTPTGKGYVEDYKDFLHSMATQYANENPNIIMVDSGKVNEYGEPILIPQLQSTDKQFLTEDWIRPIIRKQIENNPEFRNRSGTLRYKEALEKRKLTDKEFEDDLVESISQMFFTKESLSNKNLPSSATKGGKSLGSLEGTPITGEESKIGKTVKYTDPGNNVVDKVPVQIEDLDNAIQTENHYDVLKNAFKNLGVDFKAKKDDWLKSFTNQLDGATTSAITNYLINNGVSKENAVTQAPYIKAELDFSTANRRDIETNKNNAIKTVENSNKKFQNLTPNNPEVIKAKNSVKNITQEYREGLKKYEPFEITAELQRSYGNILPITFDKDYKEFQKINEENTSLLLDPNKQEQALSNIDNAYNNYISKVEKNLLKKQGIYGEYLTAIDNEVKSQYEKNKFLQGYDLNTLKRTDTKQDVGANLKSTLEGNLESFNLSDISGTSNEKVKSELMDIEKAGDTKYNASSIYYDPTKDKYIAKITVTSESKGYAKNIYADVTETVRSQDPSTNNSSLLNSQWDDTNKTSHKYYNEVYSKLKNNIPQEFTLDGTKFKITKFASDRFTIVVNGKKLPAGNFNELITQIILNKANTSTLGGDGMGKQNFFSSRMP
jgi:hypothetical protein